MTKSFWKKVTTQS